MKKLKGILNLITLVLTAGLLILVTVAWYATNKTADVTGATGSVATQPELIAAVDYYNFSGENSGTYTIADHATNQSGTCNMNEFKFVTSEPTVYLIRIKIQKNTTISSIRFISYATKFAGFGSRTVGNTTRNDANGILDTDNLNISLSSAVKFAYLGYSTNENYYVNAGNTTVTFTYPTTGWKEFAYNQSTGDIQTSTVEVLNSSVSSDANNYGYIHLLLDYSVDHLNELYGNNLSNQDALNYQDHGPEFSNKDFTIFLLG